MRYLFGKTTTNIIIATNPITYILLLLICLSIPFLYIGEATRLNDVWFILSKINKLDEIQLKRVLFALEKREEKKRSKIKKAIDRWAFNKVKNKLES